MCPDCGVPNMYKDSSGWDEDFDLNSDSISGSQDLVRVIELPGCLVASERFVRLVESSGLAGLRFRKLGVETTDHAPI